mgnify:CR=1 FL=1
MMKQDRFLQIILAVIGLLVITAIALFFIRKNSQAYGAEDTPEGVLRNYVLAVNQEDYAKAYGYLQDIEAKPDYEKFQQQLTNKTGVIHQTALKIITVEISGDEAKIKVVITRENSDLFDSRYSTNQTIALVMQDEVWKLIRMPYPFGY